MAEVRPAPEVICDVTVEPLHLVCVSVSEYVCVL